MLKHWHACVMIIVCPFFNFLLSQVDELFFTGVKKACSHWYLVVWVGFDFVPVSLRADKMLKRLPGLVSF
jgi:hypothetical protein